jgi:hypothetical protein
MQVVMDHKKRFRNVFMGMLGSMNDSKNLRLSTFYNQMTYEDPP